MNILKSYTPTARKIHRCDFCFGTIALGEKYKYDFIVQDEAYAWKTHLSCMELASKLKMFDDCLDTGLTGEDFQDGIHNQYDKLIKTDEETSFEHKLRFLKHKHHVDTH